MDRLCVNCKQRRVDIPYRPDCWWTEFCTVCYQARMREELREPVWYICVLCSEHTTNPGEVCDLCLTTLAIDRPPANDHDSRFARSIIAQVMF